MPRSIPKLQIIESALEGIEHAHKDYQEWSGGWWLWNAPEYLLTTYAAKSIASLSGPKFVTLEHSVAETVDAAGARRRGRLPEKMRSNGRADITVWWGNDTPRAVIEVKNRVHEIGRCIEDLDRLTKIQKRSDGSSLQFGLFSFYTEIAGNDANESSDLLTDRLNMLREQAEACIKGRLYLTEHRRPHHQDGCSWAAVGYELTG